MSRIGRQPIPLSGQVKVELQDRRVTVSGPKGQLSRELPPFVTVHLEESQMVVTRPSDAPKHRAMHGLTRTLLANMVTGVTEGFSKTLEIQGVGYRAQLQGSKLVLSVGFSHPVEVTPPPGISFEVEGNRVTVRGIDKEQVGQVAANIRAIRPPEPYKGKGIRYLGEYVRRKAGKAAKGGRR
ncbi:MAG TPA: 50S ribosomal protein L6 [Dehalococcoidia bacterium]